MVLRFILRYLANNEQVVNRLAESYPIRRAARFVVYLFNRSKSIVESEIASGKLNDVNLSNMRNLAARLENHLKQIKEDLEKQAKK
ncbi:protein NCBP2AS2 homolog [Homalodisca vitripennis]|uniref:protein NCBP2AS2 homolog n=1 Tax=Homalodisca vitripennis TaxID=197043 RepID=UPI001EEAEF9B|nr:protein NCBP2AS2 homolog [Homalodisca vitripennis]